MAQMPIYLNKTMVCGRLTQKAELQLSPKMQKHYITFTLAVPVKPTKANNYHKNQYPHTADFVRCCAWENIAKYIAYYYKEGDQLLVTNSFSQSIQIVDKVKKTRKSFVQLVIQECYIIKGTTGENLPTEQMPEDLTEEVAITPFDGMPENFDLGELEDLGF